MTAPARGRDAIALHQDVVRDVLPNGLTLLVRRDVSAPVVAIVTHVKAGYFDETDDVSGIAHVLEHMYFKGTPARSVGVIARETKASGGYLNAHTIYDHTCYYTVLPASAFDAGLDIQFDAYANSIIDSGELARELEVIIQEARRKRDTPTAVATESLYELLHDRHRIRRWRIGEEDTLRGFTRDHLMAFYRHWYRPSNTILSIVGDVDPDAVRQAVWQRHGALDLGSVERADGPEEIAAPGFRVREWSGDVAQVQIAFGWRTPPLHHADTPSLDLGAIALGTGRASRLYRAVRERQLASGVSAYDYTVGNAGVFVVHAESPSMHAREAAAQMWREVQAARTAGLRTSELSRAKHILEARWLRRLETMDGQAQYLASWEAVGGLELATVYYDQLLSRNADEVQQAMMRHLDPSEASVVAYRPATDEALAVDANAWRDMLRDVEHGGSSVLPPPDVNTPPDGTDTRAAGMSAPAVHTGRVTISRDHGVNVFHTNGGIPVLIMPRPGAPLVNVGVFTRGGACLEPAQRDGLARLTAQSVLKGTRRRSGARIAECAEELGGSIGVSAGVESMGWTLSVPVRHLPVALELLAEVTQQPEFADEGVETERQLAIAEVARQRDDMYRWPMRLANVAAFGSHPYARSVIGTEATLTELDASIVRAFHHAHIAQGATVVAIVGDVNVDDAAALASREFTMLEWRDDGQLTAPVWPQAMSMLDDVRHKQQTALALLFPGPSRSDDMRFASRILASVASGLGGRFFEQLRDKQSLAYTVAAFPVERRASGVFAAYIATAPHREEEARAGLLAEFQKLQSAPPTDEELRRAKTYLIGTHAIAQQSGGTVLGDMVDAWLFGTGLGELQAFDARVARVTPAEVLALAQQYFDPERRAEGIVRGTGA